MRVEIPELRRCFCCIPLRRGLIIWIYVKLVFELVILVPLINMLLIVIENYSLVMSNVLLILTLIMILVDIILSIVFLVSAHRKRHEHMRIYYRYAIVMLAIGTLSWLGLIGFEIFLAVNSMLYILYLWQIMLESITFVFVQLVLQTYFVVMLRSVILKLERETKFEFTNHTSEPECKAQITV